MIFPGRIPVENSLQRSIDSVTYTNDSVHQEMAYLFSSGNLLTNMSSTTEDIITSRFLSLYSQAKSIVNGNFEKKNYVIETFNSQEYLDAKFPTDATLNIDTNNGVLSLPIQGVEDLKVGSIIIEADSNGQPGSSLLDFINADINAILSSSASSLFEYEKIVNTYTADELFLSMTLKLDQASICNGVYLKLYAEEGSQYPTIEMIETSSEGSRWLPVDYNVEVANDYFIKFNPRRIRFLRIRLKQNSYKSITTPFGTKYRYMIGMRQIILKKIKYAASGDYITVPFSSKGNINSVSMAWDDQSINDVRYLISANNGGKWLEIKDSNLFEIVNQDAGLRGDIEVETVRVKIEMRRTASPNSASETEFTLANAEGTYFLKNAPVSITAYLGNHISRGDVQPYSVPLQTATAIASSAIAGVPNCTSDARYKVPLLYIPFYEKDPSIPWSTGLEEDLVVKCNGMELKNDGSIWTVTNHPSSMHSILMVNVDRLPATEKDKDVSGNSGANLTGTLSVTYKPYVHDHRYMETSIIQLPATSFIPTQDGFTVRSTEFIYEPIGPALVAVEDIRMLEGHPPAFGVDNDSTTYWQVSDKNKDGQWVFDIKMADYITLKSYIISPFIFDDGISRSLDFNPGKWELQALPEDTAVWITLDSQDLISSNSPWSSGIGKEFSCNAQCPYKRYRLLITMNSESTSKELQTSVGFANINLYSKKDKSLRAGTDFIVLDRNRLQILPSAYDTKADYEVTYFPAVDVSEFMALPIYTNQILMQGLHKVPGGSKMCFDYKYQDASSLEDVKYYTPFCNEYRISFT